MLIFLLPCYNDELEIENQSTGPLPSSSEVIAKAASDNDVMMQAFYWDVPSGIQ